MRTSGRIARRSLHDLLASSVGQCGLVPQAAQTFVETYLRAGACTSDARILGTSELVATTRVEFPDDYPDGLARYDAVDAVALHSGGELSRSRIDARKTELPAVRQERG